MAWYKFWKKSGPMQMLDEKYVWLAREIYLNKESIKCECENWAENIPGGHNTKYSYGFKKVACPPKNVLENLIANEKLSLKNQKYNLKLLQNLSDSPNK
jgi:hypothetical protein